MFTKTLLFTLFTFALIVFDYKQKRDIKKSLTAIGLFSYILLLGYIGFFSLKAYLPLKFIHFLILILDYLALLYFIYKNKLFYKLFFLPLITIIIYFSLDFFIGSRFEE
jgi:hypothetical protein